MHKFSGEARYAGKRIALVPTMGYLHEGHLSLVRIARDMADIVVVSIFVNPTQFAPNEDFEKYPRDINRDNALLQELNVDAVFVPEAKEVYPDGYQTYIEVENITKKQEGEFRPAHFKGVTTVVGILFNCVKPDVAVFGQKDAQQAAVIQRMTDDLKFDIKIVIAPIVREEDGLAKSSRNIYLSPVERQEALVLSQSLKMAAGRIKEGERSAKVIIGLIEEMIRRVPSSDLDYVRIVESSSFEEVETLTDSYKYYILIACRIGRTRLIDNLLIKV